MLIKAFNIDWETDGENVELPSEAFFVVDKDTTVPEIEEDLTTWLSDEYNYLVNCCEYEIVEQSK